MLSSLGYTALSRVLRSTEKSRPHKIRHSEKSDFNDRCRSYVALNVFRFHLYPRRRPISPSSSDARKLLINARARAPHPFLPRPPNYSVYFNPFRTLAGFQIGHTLVILTKLVRVNLDGKLFGACTESAESREGVEGRAGGGLPSPPLPSRNRQQRIQRRTEALPPTFLRGKISSKGGGWAVGGSIVRFSAPAKSPDPRRVYSQTLYSWL